MKLNEQNSLNGVLLVDKPKDFTSHDVVAKARGMIGERKIGHSGTLDPMATGVLPLFIGKSTKAIGQLPDTNKKYQVSFKLGLTTDTQDITGAVLNSCEVNLHKDEVFNAIKSFKGEQEQLPPMYSAVQVDGKRLYKLAREGVEIERPKRKITVYDISQLGYNSDKDEYCFDISCSKGTYVRTICHDIGEKLGTGAVLTELRRTESNGFSVENAVTLAELQRLRDENRINERIISPEQIFMHYDKLILSETLAKHFKNGVPLWLKQFDLVPDNQWFRIYDCRGAFLGIAMANKDKNQLSNPTQF